MDLSERISRLVQHSGMNIPRFAEFAGFQTPEAVRSLVNGRTRTLSDSARVKLLSAFPDLSEDWLIDGVGDMFPNQEQTTPATIQGRILTLINHLRISKLSFAQKIGMAHQNLSAILLHRRSCGEAVINRIIVRFPQVNKDWLLHGEGEMLSTPIPQITHSDLSYERATRIRQMMDVFGINQAQLASRTGLTQSSLSSILSARRGCGENVINKIILAFPNVNKDWLMYGDGEMLNIPDDAIALNRINKIIERYGRSNFLERLGIVGHDPQDLVADRLQTNLPEETVEHICNAFPALEQDWVRSGVGSMFSSETSRNNDIELVEPEVHFVPIISIDSVGGLNSPNEEDTPPYIEGTLPIKDAHPNDVVIRESGTSMSPIIPPGAYIQIRPVENWRQFIGYGNIFVLLLEDGRRVTKEIRRYEEDPNNYFWCVSANPDIRPEELPKSLIRGVWKVIRIFIDKGW